MTEFFYDLFYMLPLGIALVLSAIGTGLANSFLSLPVGGSVVSSVFIIFLLFLRHSGKKERILVGGVMLVTAVSLFLILGKEKRELLYNRYSWIIAVFVISLIAIAIGRIAQDHIKVKLAVSVIILSAVIYIMVSKAQCPKGTLGFCLSVILIYMMEIIQRFWVKSGYVDVKKHVAYIAPIILIIGILATTIPAPAEKFDWRVAKNIWKVTVTEYKRIVGAIAANKEEYSYAGFSEDAGVKSSISDSGREVMSITNGNNSFDRLYMGGITYDKFDGHKWSTKIDSESESRELDYIETRTAISKFNQGFEIDYIKVDNITVESKLFNTKYLFTPIKTNIQSTKTILPKYKETESKLLAANKIKYGDAYNINYIQLNFDNPDLILMADTACPFEEAEWNEALKKNGLVDNNSHMSYKRYLKYRDEIYKKYGGNQKLTMEEALENANLSSEVKSIVRNVIGDATIVENSKSSGDYERLRTLADYLQTMQYTKTPDKLPKEIDNEGSYLDYFLLESQSGYCVHYATAFTLLARELGHPARYVQGYYVTGAKGGSTLVTEGNAHAWTEVYFDNFGWVIFDATPGYAVSRGWTVRRMAESEMNYRPDHLKSDSEIYDVNLEEETQEKEKNYVYILYFVIPVICAVFFCMMYLLILKIVVENNYRRMNDEEKIYFMISKNLRILKILGYPLDQFVTLEEYSAKIACNADIAETIGFLKLYEKLLYSDYEVKVEDVENVEQNYQHLKNCLKAKGIRYRFYIEYIG